MTILGPASLFDMRKICPIRCVGVTNPKPVHYWCWHCDRWKSQSDLYYCYCIRIWTVNYQISSIILIISNDCDCLKLFKQKENSYSCASLSVSSVTMQMVLSCVSVGNIPYDATEEQLKEIFNQVGQVVSFRFVWCLFFSLHV